MTTVTINNPPLVRRTLTMNTWLPQGEWTPATATAPSPRTLYYRGQWSDQRVHTQADVVTRHPDGSAAVVQLTGLIPPGQQMPTNPFQLEVRNEECEDLGISLDSETAQMAGSRYGMWVEIEDPDGNIYSAPVSRRPQDYTNQGARNAELEVVGGLRARVRFPEWLVPSPLEGAQTSTNQANVACGLTVWQTHYHNTEGFDLDLKFHNGLYEAFHGPVFFRRLSLYVPAGWFVNTKHPMPFFRYVGGASEGPQRYDLIRHNDDGSLHVLAPQMETNFRLHVTHNVDVELLEDFEENRGWGIDWEAFHNQPSWGPGCYPVPDLGDKALYMDRLSDRRDSTWDKFSDGRDGSPFGGDGMVGPYHVWSSAYGGETGGTDKHLFAGMEECYAGVWSGVEFWQMRHDATLNRMGDQAIRTGNGRPVDLFDLSMQWDMSGIGHWAKKSWPQKEWDNDGMFGFYSAWPIHQRDLPDAGCHYWNRINYDPYHQSSGYMRYDYQHLQRFLATIEALIWLNNDPLARDAAEMTAVQAHMEYWEKQGGFLFRLGNPAAKGMGGNLGRDTSHALHAMALGCHVGSDRYREKIQPAFRMFEKAAQEQNMACGQPVAYKGGKTTTAYDFDGKFSIVRANELCWHLHTHRCLMMATPGDLDPQYYYEIGRIGLFTHCWAKDQAGTYGNQMWTHVACGPVDAEDRFDLFEPAEHPNEQFSAGHGQFGSFVAFAACIMAHGELLGDAVEQRLYGKYPNGVASLEADLANENPVYDITAHQKVGLLGVMQMIDA